MFPMQVSHQMSEERMHRVHQVKQFHQKVGERIQRMNQSHRKIQERIQRIVLVYR